MELYTLTSRFLPRTIISEFISVIWTERYFTAGEVNLVVPANPKTMSRLAPGTFLGLRGTKEIMQLETQSVDKGLLTVTGKSLAYFLNQRMAWFPNLDFEGSDNPEGDIQGPYIHTAFTAGEMISDVVYKMVINPTPFNLRWIPANLDWAQDKILNLELGHIDNNGTPKDMTFPLGPLYSGIERMAQDEGLGFKMYLNSAKYSTSSYVLRFATYRGRDRTSEQNVHTAVRLSPQLDSLTDVKEISSANEYKNVIYVLYKNQISTHYLLPDKPIPTGFDRRVLLVEPPDIYLVGERIPGYRETMARNALLNHIYVQAVDGKVSSKIDYKFGKDYGLGDVVELQGYSGLFSKARVVEYIRSQDQFGEQEYPTLAVIDPLETGYEPDLEPDPVDPNDDVFDEDPYFDMDLDDEGDWDPEDPDTDYDPEHDPKDEKPWRLLPKDPNPDPNPTFPYNPGPGGSSGGPKIGTGRYILSGYYPDQNQGQSLAYINFQGELKEAWIYKGEDKGANPQWTFIDLNPFGWTLDHKYLLVRSEESKESTDAYPWDDGYTWWLMNPVTGDLIRLTEVIDSRARGEASVGSTPITFAYKVPGVMWCGYDNAWRYYMSSKENSTFPYEYVYADGSFSFDPNLSDIHGPRYETQGGPVELYGAWGTGGDDQVKLDEMVQVIHEGNMPPEVRWSPFNIISPSPDGEKLVFDKRTMAGGSDWLIQASGGEVNGGSFKITVGEFGNAHGAYYEVTVAYNATVEEIYNALLFNPYLEDPRVNGYPYQPYYEGGPLNKGYQLRMTFDTTTPFGTWISIDNTNVIPGIIAQGFGVYNNKMVQKGDPHWYMSSYYGSDVEEISFGTVLNIFTGWSPDSTKLHGIAPSDDGIPYCRWLVHDVATGENVYELDFSEEVVGDSGPLQRVVYSPNSQKIAFVKQFGYGEPKKLYVASADGTNIELLYESPASPGQDDLVPRDISWSFDSQQIAIVDERDEAPVWMFDLLTDQTYKVWGGSGWDNPDEQKWIYDPQNFERNN